MSGWRYRWRVSALACAVAHLCISQAAAYDIVNRWSATQIDGSRLRRGDPVTLRWSIVPDGHSYSRSANSQVVDFLDDGWGVRQSRRTPDYTNRPWWTVINNAYAQYGRVSGVSMVYVPELTPEGTSTGMFGDIRIGGENIDGTPGGALADNTFPDDGDMRIDITRETDGSVGSYFSTEPGLRNLVIHETGHGVGLGHVEFVDNSAKAIMEGGLRTDIWGLQFDDVYALNRQYGDPRERDGGNESANTAALLGALGTTGSLSIGADAVDSVVEQFDDDWVGIDGSNDVDWYRFSASDWCFADIRLTPVGPTYTTVAQGTINATAMSDLNLRLYSSGESVDELVAVNETGLGGSEMLLSQLLPTAGDFLVRVRGIQDLNQFYQLDVSLSELPEMGTFADLNLDGLTDILDWQVFLANASVELTGLTQRETLLRGDLDIDGDNDYDDFKLFKSTFNLINGAGAFDQMLAQVPEPQALVMIAAALPVIWLTRGRRA